MYEMIRSLSLEALLLDHPLKTSEELGESLEDCMGACWMLLREVVCRLPLPDDVVVTGVIGSRVMVEDSALDDQISKLDSSCKSSQIVDIDLVLGE